MRPRSAAWCALMLLAAMACIHPTPACTQTLAHRGWAGSGLNTAPWWRSAVFYQVDPDAMQGSIDATKTSFAALADRLDYFKSLNVDALLLTPFLLAPPTAETVQKSSPDTAAQMDADFDTLLAEAGRRHTRILIDLPVGQQTSATTLALARFWMARGVAGLRLGLTRKQASAGRLSPGDLVGLVKDLRALCATYPGDRVLLWDSDEPFAEVEHAEVEQTSAARPASQRVHRVNPSGRTLRRWRWAVSRRRILRGSDRPQLEVDHTLEQLPSLNASELRATLILQSPQNPAIAPLLVAVTDSDGVERSFSRYTSVRMSDAGQRMSDSVQSSADATARAKLLAAALLTGRSLPMIFFGQEIGMEQQGPGTKATFEVPPTPASAPNPSVRGDAAPATPQTFAHAGPADDADANSLLNFYRRLGSLRHANPALESGSFRLLGTAQTDIVAWVRVARGSGARQTAVVVVCNVSDRPETVGIEAALRDAGIPAYPGSTLQTLAESGLRNLASGASEPAAAIALAPYGVLIGQLEPSARVIKSTARVRSSTPMRRRSRHTHR